MIVNILSEFQIFEQTAIAELLLCKGIFFILQIFYFNAFFWLINLCYSLLSSLREGKFKTEES